MNLLRKYFLPLVMFLGMVDGVVDRAVDGVVDRDGDGVLVPEARGEASPPVSGVLLRSLRSVASHAMKVIHDIDTAI